MSKSITGLIFNIVHSSLVDGPGVRTTVFLKGCPLRCLWCCNSEGQLRKKEIKTEPELCTACGKCADLCPENAIVLTDGKLAGINRERCTECGLCAEACYMNAIDVFGKQYTVDEVLDIVLRDKDYYLATGGGVTIGGGEPTLQEEFTAELMKRLHENGIHVALDTCGYTLSEKGRKLLDDADLLLFDIKGLDEQTHTRCTGVSNKPILENLSRRNDLGKDIIIRLPLIPGWTDSDENITAEAELLSGCPAIIRVDIIPYHDYGKIKFYQRGRAYPMEGTERLTDARVEEIKAILEQRGLKVQIGG